MDITSFFRKIPIPRLTFEKALPRVQASPSQSRMVSASSFEQLYSNILDSEIPTSAIEKWKRNNVNVKIRPLFHVYANMYAQSSSVSAGVNKKANDIAGIQTRIVDSNGYEHEPIMRELEKKFNLTALKKKAQMNRDLYGLVNYCTFKPNHEKSTKPQFQIISPNECTDFIVNADSFEIVSFTWNKNDIFTYHRIDKYNIEDKFQNFYISTTQDPDDLFFGSPRLKALYNSIEGRLQDDANYRLFLQNGSYPGVIAIVGKDTDDSTVQELQSFLDGMRDQQNRFKGKVIRAVSQSSGYNQTEVNDMIEFTTVNQKIESRMTVEEKREISGEVYDNLFIPRILMGLNQSSGIGANEYTPALVQYKRGAIDPDVRILEEDFNNYLLPIMLKYLEYDGFFERYDGKIKEDGIEREITTQDLSIKFDEYDASLPPNRAETGLKLVQQGMMSVADYKKWALGYKESDLSDVDHIRFIPSSATIVAESDMKLQSELTRLMLTQALPKQIVNDVSQESTDTNNDTNLDDESGLTNATTQNNVIDVTPLKIIIKSKPIIKTKKDIHKIQNALSTEFIRINKSGKIGKKIKDDVLILTKSKEISPIPKLLQRPEFVDMRKDIQTALTKQIQNSDIEAIVELIQKKEFTKATDKDKDKSLLKQIKQLLNPLSNYLNENNLIKSLIIIARMGRDTILSQYREEKKEDIKPQLIQRLQEVIKNYLMRRVNNRYQSKDVERPQFEDIQDLMVKAREDKDKIDSVIQNLENTIDDEENNVSIANPDFEGDLDDTLAKNVLEKTRAITTKQQDLNSKEIAAMVTRQLLSEVPNRAKLIAEDNLARSYSFALFVTGLVTKAKTKTWLESKANEKRKEHLKMVGETVPYESKFSNGSFWTQEEINCQCSIKTNF